MRGIDSGWSNGAVVMRSEETESERCGGEMREIIGPVMRAGFIL